MRKIMIIFSPDISKKVRNIIWIVQLINLMSEVVRTVKLGQIIKEISLPSKSIH